MKIKEFQKILKKKNIDFFLAVNIDFERCDYDMTYFSGYNGVGLLVIPNDKKPFLIVSGMEKKRAQKGGLKVYSPGKSKRLFDWKPRRNKRSNLKKKQTKLRRICKKHLPRTNDTRNQRMLRLLC